MKNTLFLMILSFFSLFVFGQETKQGTMEITGTVKEAGANDPLAGVYITIKEQPVALTDVNGKYSLKASKGDVLKFSYLGMTPREIRVSDRTVINVEMTSNSELEEFVKIGYGVVAKSDLTGAVSSLNTEDVLKTNPVSINQALQGRIAGVNVMQTDGAPGSAISIQIRGANSFGSNTEPLFVVDGVPFESSGSPSGGRSVNALSFINPQDIESLEVLKDASATAIYGARGANGVILITTRKGKKGEDKIQIGSNFTASYLVNKVKFLDGHDYAVYSNERAYNHYHYHQGWRGQEPEFKGKWGWSDKGYWTYNPSPQDFLNGYMNGGTDWIDQITQDVISQEHTINYSGANESGDHFVSGSFLDQQGIIYGSGFERATLRMNVNRNIRHNIKAGTSISFTASTTKFAMAEWEASNVFASALYFPPTEQVLDPRTFEPNDELFHIIGDNPYRTVRETQDKSYAKNVHISAYASIDFLKYFQLKQTFGYGYNYSERHVYVSGNMLASYINGSSGSQSDYWNTNMSHETLLTYNQSFTEKHKVNAIAAFTAEEFNYGNKNMWARDFPNDYLLMYNMGTNMDKINQSLGSGRGRSRMMSFLGRINYTLNERFLFTTSARIDGSSKFAKGNKYADFYSFAFAWRAEQEEFIKNLNVFNMLKPRISYGETGNQAIHNYQTLEMLISTNNAVNGTIKPGYVEAVWKGPVNKDLKWETTSQINLGLDMGFFDHRLSVTLDAYYKKTRDLLQNVTIPPSSGFNLMATNHGHVTNKGLEVSVNTRVLDKTPLKWDIDANIYWNRNEIGGIGYDQFSDRLLIGFDDVFIQRDGYPIGTIYGYVHDGYYDNEAEVRANPEFSNADDNKILAMIGEEKWKNMDDDPSSISITDKVIIGDANPDFQFGITNNFTWKNFTFSFFIQGNVGGSLINANLLKDVKMLDNRNIPQFAFEERWRPGLSGEAGFSKPNYGTDRIYKFSDRFLEDATYVRLKNINIGYSLHNPIKYISNAHFYANASNVLTITGYRWFDPDVNSFGGDVSRRGVDLSAYPTYLTISAGLRLTF